eukprot:s242_g16.t1
MECDQRGGAPITPVTDGGSDHDLEIPSSSTKHAAGIPLSGERVKVQKMDDDPVPMPKVKASRTDEHVNQVEDIDMCHNDESMFPDGLEDNALIPDPEDEYIAGQGEGDGPPEVSAEKLQQLEEQAALDEVEKLFQMDLIEPESVATTENVVDTALVYDWRYRNQQWIRRCRIVAREFKTGATDENNFSPTSSFASVRMLPTFALIYDLAVTALDVKDAALMVPQLEVLYVKIPMWIRRWTGNPHTHWLLKRCLPGQRNAALQWHQHIGGCVIRLNWKRFLAHQQSLDTRILIERCLSTFTWTTFCWVCNPGDVEWFQSTVGSTLTMKVDGPHLPGSGSQVMHLKKRMAMRPDGILLQPNSTYIPKLVALMKVSSISRRKKGLPYHATLESFNAALVIESEMLDMEQAAAELYAANGLMVECMYIYRLCKFLCKDETEANNGVVQQRLYMDSSSAMALVQRAGTGRLKHVQIKEFYLQNLLRAGIFTIHKINTKVNPSDLNTKRLNSERRKFLGRLIGLCMAHVLDENDDNEVRRVRRINQVTRQQCVRLVQLAAATLGISTQLKGCSSASRAGIPPEFLEQEAAWVMVADSMDGLATFAFHGLVIVVFTMCKLLTFAIGVAVLVACAIFILLGPLTWRNSIAVRWFERRFAANIMGWRHRLFIFLSLKLARWLLGLEIDYLHARFRAAGQRGDMMVDIESIYADLNEFLGGERVRLDMPRDPVEAPDAPMLEGEGEEEQGGGDEDPPDDDAGNDENGDEIVDQALTGYRLNGQTIDRNDQHGGGDDSDASMGEETAEERRIRYNSSTQEEFPDPDEWASIHYGHMEQDEYERMIALSRTNRIRLTRAAQTLRRRHDEAATAGNWEEAANCVRALGKCGLVGEHNKVLFTSTMANSPVLVPARRVHSPPATFRQAAPTTAVPLVTIPSRVLRPVNGDMPQQAAQPGPWLMEPVTARLSNAPQSQPSSFTAMPGPPRHIVTSQLRKPGENDVFLLYLAKGSIPLDRFGGYTVGKLILAEDQFTSSDPRHIKARRRVPSVWGWYCMACRGQGLTV